MTGNPSGVSGQKANEAMNENAPATYTLTPDQYAVLTNALLATFDAGSRRVDILAEIEREAALMPEGAAAVFAGAAAMLRNMKPGPRIEARASIVGWLESIAVGEPVAPVAQPEADPTPLPVRVASEPIGVQVAGAQAVAAAASDATPEPTQEPSAPPPDAPTVPAQATAKPSSVPPEPAPMPQAPTGESAEETAIRVASAEMPADVVDPYKTSVWLQITFSRIGVTRDVSDRVLVTALEATEKSATGDESEGAQGVKARTTIKLLSDCKQHASIESADNSFRLAIRSIALPSIMRGAYPVPIALMDRVEALVKQYMDVDRPALVKGLERVYDAEVTRDRDVVERLDPLTGKRKYPGLWSASDYPTRAAAIEAYRAAASWVDIAGSARLPTAMAARNAEGMKLQQREAWAEIRAAARVQAGAMLDDLTDLLRPGEDGKRRTFRDVRVEKMQGWLKDLAARDVTNDKALADVAAQIKATLDGVTDWKAVRESGTARDAIAAKLDKAREALRTLGVGTAGPRKFKARAPAAEGNGSTPAPTT